MTPDELVFACRLSYTALNPLDMDYEDIKWRQEVETAPTAIILSTEKNILGIAKFILNYQTSMPKIVNATLFAQNV